MKTIIAYLLVLIMVGMVYAGDESLAEYKFLEMPMSSAFSACSITITNNDKEATINFCGDKIVYSGELPVDESAKIFFEYVFDNMKCREKLADALFDMLYGKFDATDRAEKVYKECKP